MQLVDDVLGTNLAGRQERARPLDERRREPQPLGDDERVRPPRNALDHAEGRAERRNACQQNPTKGGYTSSDGNFSVSIPAAPSEQVQKSGSLTIHQFVATQDDVAYIIIYVDYPAGMIKPGMEERVLNAARDGATGNSKGRLLKERHIKLQGKYPGRELLVLTADGKTAVKDRIYLVGNRMYQVMVSGTQEKLATPEIKAYLDSFQLTGN